MHTGWKRPSCRGSDSLLAVHRWWQLERASPRLGAAAVGHLGQRGRSVAPIGGAKLDQVPLGLGGRLSVITACQNASLACFPVMMVVLCSYLRAALYEGVTALYGVSPCSCKRRPAVGPAVVYVQHISTALVLLEVLVSLQMVPFFCTGSSQPH